MLTGSNPFYDEGMDQIALFKKICSGSFKVPSSLSVEISDLVTHMLKLAPNQRLGSFAGGDNDIKNHGWFGNFDFDALVETRLKAPWKPNVKNPLDVSMFDNWDHMDTKSHQKPLSSNEQKLFEDFGTYI